MERSNKGYTNIIIYRVGVKKMKNRFFFINNLEFSFYFHFRLPDQEYVKIYNYLSEITFPLKLLACLRLMHFLTEPITNNLFLWGRMVLLLSGVEMSKKEL